jgi:hypothetical protein
VLIGTNGGEYGVRGFIKAFDANDGKLLWTFYSIPEKGHEGVWDPKDATGKDMHVDIAAEKPAFAKDSSFYQTLGRWRWDDAGYRQEDAHRVLLGGQPVTGSLRGDPPGRQPVHQLDGRHRSRQGHVTSGISNISLTTSGIWDAVSPAIPHPGQGQERQDGRRGDSRRQRPATSSIHERNTGKLIRFSEPMIPQENMWVLPTKDGARMLPGANGGVEWSPMAVDPTTRLAYAANLHQPMTYHVEETPYPGGKLWLGGAFKVIPTEDSGVASSRQSRHRQGRVGRQDAATVDRLAVLATAGGVVFNGEANGWFKAFDSKTGKELWKYNCGAGVNAPASPSWSAASNTSRLLPEATTRSTQSARQQRFRVRVALTSPSRGWPLRSRGVAVFLRPLGAPSFDPDLGFARCHFHDSSRRVALGLVVAASCALGPG